MEKINKLPAKEAKLLAKHVGALQLDFEGLMKLLGGTQAKQQQYWEILKGLTSYADFENILKVTETLEQSIRTARESAEKLSNIG